MGAAMHEMSRDEWRAFLLEGMRTAKLATTRKDGRPHVSPKVLARAGIAD